MTNFYAKSLFCFLLLALIEFGCCMVETCDCSSSSGATRYRIKSYSLKTYAGASVVSVTRQTVPVKDLKMIVTPTHEFITSLPRFTKALYACSPAEPAPTQSITAFKVTSTSDFLLPDRTIAAGQNLNELFLLDDGPNGEGSLVTFLQASNVDATVYEYTLSFLRSVSRNQTHQFTIDISLSDNQKFTLTSTEVELVP